MSFSFSLVSLSNKLDNISSSASACHREFKQKSLIWRKLTNALYQNWRCRYLSVECPSDSVSFLGTCLTFMWFQKLAHNLIYFCLSVLLAVRLILKRQLLNEIYEPYFGLPAVSKWIHVNGKSVWIPFIMNCSFVFSGVDSQVFSFVFVYQGMVVDWKYQKSLRQVTQILIHIKLMDQ